jgi:hypothetical protein
VRRHVNTFLIFFESRIAEGGSATAEDLTADYADGTDNRNSQNDQDQMSTNDPNGRENFIKRKSFALGAPDLRLRRCHRLQPPSPRLRRAKEEADPPLAQRAEALPKIDPRKRSWDKAAMHGLGPLPSESMLAFFMGALFFRQARGNV